MEFSECPDFCRDLNDRGWLLTEEDGQTFRWRLEIQKQIILVKGIKVSTPHKDIARQKQPLQNQHLTEEHVDIETRKEITSWLSSPTVNWNDFTLDESNALTSYTSKTTKLNHWLKQLESGHQ